MYIILLYVFSRQSILTPIIYIFSAPSDKLDEMATGAMDQEEEPMVVVENPMVSKEWWAEFLKTEDRYNIEMSGKLLILSEILRMAETIGDKV